MILKKAVERQGNDIEITGRIADILSNYASLLASQGSMEAALSYLGASNEEKVAELRDRLNWSLGRNEMVTLYKIKINGTFQNFVFLIFSSLTDSTSAATATAATTANAKTSI